jgi:hypothetical protein
MVIGDRAEPSAALRHGNEAGGYYGLLKASRDRKPILKLGGKYELEGQIDSDTCLRFAILRPVDNDEQELSVWDGALKMALFMIHS